MDIQLNDEKLVDVFCQVDDLLTDFRSYSRENKGSDPFKKRGPDGRLSASEVVCIQVCYHLSGYKNFEYYYREAILGHMREAFPAAPGYKRFNQLVAPHLPFVYLYLMWLAERSERKGLFFIDSKPLPVCHIRRERQHRVFDGMAAKGKSSTGWFYGLKAHLVINHRADIVRFELTPGNVADNNRGLLRRLTGGLEGTCVGDKGYQSALFGEFYERGLHLLTKPKKHQKGRLQTLQNNGFINKRGLIESVFNITGAVCDIEHTRHRNPFNALAHILAALAAYQVTDRKPSIIIMDERQVPMKTAA